MMACRRKSLGVETCKAYIQSRKFARLTLGVQRWTGEMGGWWFFCGMVGPLGKEGR